MRSLAFIAALVVAPSLAFAQAPVDFVPSDSLAVIRWTSPGATLERVEALARRAGQAPPSAKDGFLLQQLSAQAPILQVMDLTKPVWVAIEAPVKGAQPGFMVTFTSKSKLDAVPPLMPEQRSKIVGTTVLLATPTFPAAKMTKAKKKFAFSSSGARKVAGESDIAADIDAPAMKAVLTKQMASVEGADAQSIIEQFEDTERMTIGLQLTDTAVLLSGATQLTKGSQSQKDLAGIKAVKGSSIVGLPLANYAVLMGMAGGSAVSASMTSRIMKSLEETMSATGEKVPPGMDALITEFARLFESSTRATLGVEIPGGKVDALQIVGVLGGSSKKLNQLMTSLVERMQSVEASSTGAPSKLKINRAGAKVKGQPFVTVGPAELPANEAPLRYGPAGKDALIVLFNTNDAFGTRAFDAATTPKRMVDQQPRLQIARKQLPDTLALEIYVDAGPIAGAAMAGQNAMMAQTLQAALSAVPPLALGYTKLNDTEPYGVLYVPTQLVEIAASMGAAMGGGAAQ